MKKRYKHKTGIFGTDSERFASQLFYLMKNPEHQRRPDLISINGRYSPRLSLEVKSGRKNKGVLVEYQLHYSITSEEDYRNIFREEFPQQADSLPGVDWKKVAPVLNPSSVAYYYYLINRIDELTAEDVIKPWSALQIKWGDQYIVPNEFGFYAFAVARARRTEENLEKVILELKDRMKQNVLQQHSLYYERKNSQSWQDLHGRDILALHQDDLNLATTDGMERIRMMKDCYPELNTLERIVIDGPNRTKIYVLAEQAHFDLFNDQLRRTVEERTPIIEKVTRSRKLSEKIIGEFKLQENGVFHANGYGTNEVTPITTKKLFSVNSLSLPVSTVRRLNRLVHWLDAREKAVGSDVKLNGNPLHQEMPEEDFVPF